MTTRIMLTKQYHKVLPLLATQLPIQDAEIIERVHINDLLEQPQQAKQAKSQQLARNKKSTDPTPVVFAALEKLKIPTASLGVAAVLSVAVLLASPMQSQAAMTGGRMGGGG